MNFGEVRRTQLAKSTHLLSTTLMPLRFFRSFLRSVQMIKRDWGAERNGKLPHLFIPHNKTAAMVPEFTVEDRPSAELQHSFLRLKWRTCPWAQHFDDDILIARNKILHRFGHVHFCTKTNIIGARMKKTVFDTPKNFAVLKYLKWNIVHNLLL